MCYVSGQLYQFKQKLNYFIYCRIKRKILMYIFDTKNTQVCGRLNSHVHEVACVGDWILAIMSRLLELEFSFVD